MIRQDRIELIISHKKTTNQIKKYREIIIKLYFKYIYNYIHNFIIIFLFVLSYYLYYLSLEKCFDGEAKCCLKTKWIKKKVIQEIVSSIIVSFLFELMLLKIISKLHLFHFFVIIMYFYKYSHGIDFDNHGYFNLLGFIAIILLVLIILLPFNGLIYFYKKKYLFYYIAFLLTIIITFYCLIDKKINCDDWAKGLNDTYIENNVNKFGCEIRIPRECPYKLGKYFLDITKIKGINCKKGNINSRKTIIKHSKSPFISKKTKRFGYPLMNKNPICFLDYKDNIKLEKYFINNIIDMDKKSLKHFLRNNKPEVEVDFSKNPYGKLIINLNFNKTLSEKRKKLEGFVTPYSNNIMILFVDSVSRVNSLRQLKKTLKFFEYFMNYKGNHNPKYPSENFHSFQFFKYHSFLYYTPGNYPKIFHGNEANKNNILITKYMKENGYITCYSGDLCNKEGPRTFHSLSIDEVYDHQFIICDPNKQHPYITTIGCLYGKKSGEHLYEYSKQFWRKYYNNRKFMAILTNDGHEGTLEVLKYVDDTIFNFLNDLYNDNLLKDTSIFLLSDHGVTMPSIYYLYNFFQFESHLPMLFVIINDRKNISYKEQYMHIHNNQQTFVTGYDIYNTIGHLVYGDKYSSIKNKTIIHDTPKSKFGQSLFTNL